MVRWRPRSLCRVDRWLAPEEDSQEDRDRVVVVKLWDTMESTDGDPALVHHVDEGLEVKAVDCMGFAGSMACGVDQAGFDVIAKREPAVFKGFGVNSMLYNMPWVEAQVSEPSQWDLPTDPVELLFGCPPCTGFSQLSYANKFIHNSQIGMGAPINECMRDLVEYAARVKPRVVIMESVGRAFGGGRLWMEELFGVLKEKSGLPYQLTHVNMNAALVGGDVVRPRYFFVASLDPFGVGLEFVQPRTVDELLADLPELEDPDDHDWAQFPGAGEIYAKSIAWLKTQGRDWPAGTRLPDNNKGLEPPDFWIKKPGAKPSGRLPAGMKNVLSHWFSDDMFSTYRWPGNKPFGVVVAASLGRALHPHFDRAFTWRELARFMSLPDDWSLKVLVDERRGGELGKAVPTASAKWIAHWAKTSIEGVPGEYAGVVDGSDPDIRVIQVQRQNQVDLILKSPPKGAFYEAPTADPSPSTWIVDRKQRPERWWQRG